MIASTDDTLTVRSDDGCTPRPARCPPRPAKLARGRYGPDNRCHPRYLGQRSRDSRRRGSHPQNQSRGPEPGNSGPRCSESARRRHRRQRLTRGDCLVPQALIDTRRRWRRPAGPPCGPPCGVPEGGGPLGAPGPLRPTCGRTHRSAPCMCRTDRRIHPERPGRAAHRSQCPSPPATTTPNSARRKHVTVCITSPFITFTGRLRT